MPILPKSCQTVITAGVVSLISVPLVICRMGGNWVRIRATVATMTLSALHKFVFFRFMSSFLFAS